MIPRTLTIEVCSLAEVMERAKAALAGEGDDADRYSFQTHADLLRTLTPNRWGLLEALTGAGPLGVRELARRVGRDVKGVHTDAQALVLVGLIDKAEDGKLHFPYDAIHVDFMLKAA
ncbi:transcriptional regulator [Thermomonas brevis]